MTHIFDAHEYLKRMAIRKAELGITEAEIAAARNSGANRTPEKRELLARIAERAKRAGKTPLPARY